MNLGLVTTPDLDRHHGNGFGINPEVLEPPTARPPSSQPFHYLPTEVWLSIFPFLSNDDLSSVTQTCQIFRLLSQPLLFQVLDVCPFFLAFHNDQPIRRPRRYLQTTLDRLDFYTLPRIAPAVNQLWISPYARRGFPPRRLADDLDPALVVSAIIDRLSAFPNIRSLAWHCIDISPSWWATLQRLPSLTKLWINSCTVLPLYSPTPLLLPLQRITHLDLDQWAWEGHITNHVSIHEERLGGANPLMLSSVIHAESIRTISVPRHNTALHLLSILGKFGSGSQCMLSSLTIPYSSTSSEDFISALIQLASLKDLHIILPRDGYFHHPDLKDKLPSSSISHLETYEGPFHLLPIFSNVRYHKPRRLRFVKLWGLDERAPAPVCDPHQLEPILEEMVSSETSSAALEMLHVPLTHVTTGLIIILSQFTNMKEIIIESQDSLIPVRSSLPRLTMELLPESPISVLYVLMRSHKFSTSLKRLTLVTHLKNTSNLDSATQQAEASMFLEGLGQANPRLERVNIRYGTYWTGIVAIAWRRRMFGMSEGGSNLTWGGDCVSNGGLDLASPLAKSSAASCITLPAFEDPEITIDKFLALPPRPSITTTVNLRLGLMTFTEQRRAVVLPARTLAPEEIEAATSGLGWLTRGMSQARRLVKGIVSNVGFGQHGR